MEPVGKASGVEYFDDSKATNPHATLSALDGFERVVLLAGGDSKGVDLGVLAQARTAPGRCRRDRRHPRGGGARARWSRADGACRLHGAAVDAAAALAQPGDTVLLSPACASFDWYESYEQRGDDFQQEVRRLIAEQDARA